MTLDKNDPKSISEDAFEHLIYLRVYEGCNLHCEHCFIPSNPKKMQVVDFENIGVHLERFCKEGDRILFQWHGGEPTALGPRWFRNAIESVNKAAEKYVVSHGIQTNMMNYNEKWRDIFVEFFDSDIGISWDPEIRLMKKDSPETNAEFEIKFWENVGKLIDDNIKPYLIITGTKVFYNKFINPFNLFAFLESKRIRRVHIERLTKTGYARESWDKIGITNLEYSMFMTRLYHAYKIYSNRPRAEKQPLNISPLDGLIESVEKLRDGKAGGFGCLSGACDTRFHTIDSNGYKKGCTALTSEVDNKSVGDAVKKIQFSDIRISRKLRQVDCMGCEFKPICSSGCLASDKMDLSGECSGGSKLFEVIKSHVFKGGNQ